MRQLVERNCMFQLVSYVILDRFRESCWDLAGGKWNSKLLPLFPSSKFTYFSVKYVGAVNVVSNPAGFVCLARQFVWSVFILF